MTILSAREAIEAFNSISEYLKKVAEVPAAAHNGGFIANNGLGHLIGDNNHLIQVEKNKDVEQAMQVLLSLAQQQGMHQIADVVGKIDWVGPKKTVGQDQTLPPNNSSPKATDEQIKQLNDWESSLPRQQTSPSHAQVPPSTKAVQTFASSEDASKTQYVHATMGSSEDGNKTQYVHATMGSPNRLQYVTLPAESKKHQYTSLPPEEPLASKLAHIIDKHLPTGEKMTPNKLINACEDMRNLAKAEGNGKDPAFKMAFEILKKEAKTMGPAIAKMATEAINSVEKVTAKISAPESKEAPTPSNPGVSRK